MKYITKKKRSVVRKNKKLTQKGGDWRNLASARNNRNNKRNEIKLLKEDIKSLIMQISKEKRSYYREKLEEALKDKKADLADLEPQNTSFVANITAVNNHQEQKPSTTKQNNNKSKKKSGFFSKLFGKK